MTITLDTLFNLAIEVIFDLVVYSVLYNSDMLYKIGMLYNSGRFLQQANAITDLVTSSVTAIYSFDSFPFYFPLLFCPILICRPSFWSTDATNRTAHC